MSNSFNGHKYMKHLLLRNNKRNDLFGNYVLIFRPALKKKNNKKTVMQCH